MESRAYTQVNYIINEMSEELRSKIPEEILKNIESKMDKSYEFYIEENELEDVELLEDTEKILSVIYTDYLATDEERKAIKTKEIAIELRRESLKQKNYPSDFIKKRNVNKTKENDFLEEQALTVVKKEKFYTKILNKIKKLLGFIK